jgi:RAP domain/FAST kinase-like protein, subdomain 1
MKRHERLKSYQVAATWNRLGKAVQSSRSKSERQNFWIVHKSTLQTLVDQTIHSANEFDGRSTATATHSMVKLLHLTNPKQRNLVGEYQALWNALLTTTRRHVNSGSFDAHSLSNLAWAYAKATADGIAEVDGRLLDALAERAELCVGDFVPQGLSNIAWGFATMNHKAPSLFDAIAKISQERITEFGPQALPNASWAFATMNHEAPSLFDAIARTAKVRTNDFNAQVLSNLILAYAKMNHNSPELFDAIAKACQARIDEFDPQALANTAWSFAKLNHHEAPSLFDAIAKAARARIKEFNPQAFSNTSWAFATLKHEAPLLFDAIARAAPVRIGDFEPQGLANTAWAFATMKHGAPWLFDTMAKVAQGRINEFKPQALSNLIMAYTKMNYNSPELFDAIANAAQERIYEFKPQELSNMAWSFATLNREAESLFGAIAKAAQGRIQDFNPQELANTSWSFATLNHQAPSLFKSIARATQVQISDFDTQNLANIAWSFAVFNIEPDSFILADSPFAKTLRSRDPSKFTVEEVRQLHQFHLWCHEAFVSEEAVSSLFQNNVVETLRTLPDVSQVEVEVLAESGYNLDAVIVYQGERIGVEVDGPFHFVGSPSSQSPNGATLLKRRQLRALEGWKLVAIPYWEWEEIEKEGSNMKRTEKRQMYLQKLLDEAIVRSSDAHVQGRTDSNAKKTDSDTHANVSKMGNLAGVSFGLIGLSGQRKEPGVLR